MRHRIFYNPLTMVFTFILLLLLSVVVSFLFFGLVSSAFAKLGFSWGDAFLLLFLCLIGSNINVPLTTLETEVPIPNGNFVKVFGVKYRVPFMDSFVRKTTVAVNIGGAVIPIFVSVYLLYTYPGVITYSLYGIMIVAAITKLVARPVKGVGIVTPGTGTSTGRSAKLHINNLSVSGKSRLHFHNCIYWRYPGHPGRCRSAQS